jgi:2-polyprenyl-3-methyl-5-hydroxy-6-metoxy-1,4-benzoquinol methylase
MLKISYSPLSPEASEYWAWHTTHPILPMDNQVAREGAGSELRSPLFHYGTVLPIYLSVIRYLRKLPTTKGIRLVELGSGTGRLLAYMQSLFPYMEITGTDYSEACISYAKRAYGQYGVTFIHDSAQKTTLKAGTMDIVISSHVIEHVNKDDGYLFVKESYRLLKKNGMAFIGTPERRKSQDTYGANPTDAPALRLVPPHEHEYTHEELTTLGQAIYGSKQAQVDKIFNPTFRKIFSGSIAKFKPYKNSLNLTNLLYRTVRDNLPKLWFDFITRAGAQLTMHTMHLSYKKILLANTIESPKSQKISDNLLLVAQK